MRETNTISITTVGEGIDIKRIDAELKALLLSNETTIPGSRAFGLTGEFLSRPRDEAINLLAIELEKKVEEFIPEITIANVEDNSRDAFSEMSVTIYVERRDAI